jgi:hypothetical protein
MLTSARGYPLSPQSLAIRTESLGIDGDRVEKDRVVDVFGNTSPVFPGDNSSTLAITN